MSSKQTLDQNTRTVPLETSFQSVDVYFQIELVLVCAWLVAVVRYVPAHILIHASEPIAKGCIFNPLFISDDILVKCFESRYAVDHEMSVARNVAEWVVEKCAVQHVGQSSQRLKVLPFAQLVAM